VEYAIDLAAGAPAAGAPPEGELRATARVGVPAEWSRKGGVSQRPHLSTIDAVVLAVELAQAQLTAHRRLGADALRAVWVRRIVVRAGTSPLEEGLDGVPVACTTLGVEEPADAGQPWTIRAGARIGPMKVRLGLASPHPVGPALRGGPEAAADAVLGLRATNRLYADGFRHRGVVVEDVEVGDSSTRAAALLRVVPGSAAGGSPAAQDAGEPHGLESAYWPAVHLIDVFVAALQLGQVLLYGLDGMDRADSSTLWMRTTEFEVATPERPPSPGPMAVRLENVALLTSRGARWRTADIVSTGHRVRLRCSVTHRLP
jgi:hypothetical protein